MFGLYSNWGPAADLPDVGNVLEDDTVGGVSGTFVDVAANKVQTGQQWGEDGTESTGTLDVTGDDGLFFLKRG